MGKYLTFVKGCFSSRFFVICFLLCACLLLFSASASAQVTNAAVFSDILQRYQSVASAWSTTISKHATWLFWCLVSISMIWTFGMMALRKSDLGEFVAEFVRFTIFTGFFWWLLSNGPSFAGSIIKSLQQIASEASGQGQQVNPGHIAKMGFAIFFNAVQHISMLSPLTSAVGLVLSGLIMIVAALIGANMLLLLCAAWLLAYAGVFFLGFGGSRWTSDIAVNYYKKILEVGASLFTMILLLGVGQSFIDAYYSKMNQGQDIDFSDMGVMLVVAIILLFLVEKVPPLVCGIVTGASIGHAGIGNFGAGAAIGATALAVGAAGMAGGMVAGGARNIAGGASAVMEACRSGQHHMSSPGSAGMSEGFSGGFGGSTGSGLSPLAMACGDKPRSGASMTAGAVGRLVKGVGKVAGDAVNAKVEATKERISQTTGGKIANAIKELREGGNSLGAGKVRNPNPEIQSFIDGKGRGF
jgi:type IV secretion system protein TrbL